MTRMKSKELKVEEESRVDWNGKSEVVGLESGGDVIECGGRVR